MKVGDYTIQNTTQTQNATCNLFNYCVLDCVVSKLPNPPWKHQMISYTHHHGQKATTYYYYCELWMG